MWQRQAQAVADGVPMRVLEEVTTAKKAPTQLRRVGDNLYRRLEDSQQTQGPAASPVDGAGSVGGDDPLSGAARVQGDLVFQAGVRQEDMGTTPAPLVGLQETGDDIVQGGGAEEDRGGEETCFVCLDAPREAVFLECGHGGVCVACAQSLWTRTPHSRHCPICREIFTGIVRITEHAGDTIAVETVEYAYASDGANRRLLYAPITADLSATASAAADMPVRHGDFSFVSIVQLQAGLLRSSHRGGQPPPPAPPPLPPISSGPALLPTASSERTRVVVIDVSSGHHLPTQSMQGR